MTDAIDQAAQDLDAERALLVLEADLCGHDLSWLPVFFLRKKFEAQAARELVKEQAATLLRQIDTRERALDWNWGQAFREQVTSDLQAQGGGKKSVTYLTGSAGFRASKEKLTVDVVDDETAIAYLEANHPEAVKKSVSKSALKAYIEASGDDVPGVNVETVLAGDNFYPKFGQPVLEQDDEQSR